MTEWGYIWEINHRDAGRINPDDFWKPIFSLSQVVAHRWRKMVLMLRDDPAIETHAVFRRTIPIGSLFIQTSQFALQGEVKK